MRGWRGRGKKWWALCPRGGRLELALNWWQTWCWCGVRTAPGSGVASAVASTVRRRLRRQLRRRFATAVASAAAAVVAATAGGEMGIFLSLFANAVAEVTRAPTARGAGALTSTVTRFALLLDFLECVYELFVLLCWSGVRGCGSLLPFCFQVAFYNTGPGAGREPMNGPLHENCYMRAAIFQHKPVL